MNAYAERWVRSVKEECLSKIILFGERSLPRALGEYVAHYHAERNHQGKSNVLLFPWFQEIVARSRRNVASVSVGFCVSTIERLREWVGKSRTISVKAV